MTEDSVVVIVKVDTHEIRNPEEGKGKADEGGHVGSYSPRSGG